MKKLVFLGLLLSANVYANNATVTCHQQTVGSYKSEVCLYDPGPFKHFQFSLKINGQQIFMLMDDYVEQVEIKHKVAHAPSLELPISKQGKDVIILSGGCKPILNDNQSIELGRLCNFKIGSVQLIKDMKFIEN